MNRFNVQGLISMILLVITMLEGVWAYYSFQLRSFIKPGTSKFWHNLTSVLCFITGMVSLMYGYTYGDTHDVFTTKDMEYSLIAVAIITMLLTLIGAVKSELKFIEKVMN